MKPEEIKQGVHYVWRHDPVRAGSTRRVHAIADGRVWFIDARGGGAVSLRAFAGWAARELAPGEPAVRGGLVLQVGDRRVWSIYEEGRRMSFWYGVHPQDVYCCAPRAPLAPGDNWFDVRELPAKYLAGLEIEIVYSLSHVAPGLSPVEANIRQFRAHIVAIARAMDDGHPLVDSGAA